MRKAVVAVAGLVLALQAGVTAACGYCVEDKIASTYDHAVVTYALGRKHHVAYFHIDGSPPATERVRRLLEAAAMSTAGVDRETVRVSLETTTISFAFDPQRTSLAKVQGAMDRKLAACKLSLMPLRVMDRPAELKSVRAKM